MPMFDFRCRKCNNEFEELVFSWDDKTDILCPECSSQDIEKLFSAPVAIGSSSSCEYSTAGGCNAPIGSGFS